MSHRKFHAPRHGSMKFLPRKRCRRHRPRIRSFPPDDKTKPCHLTAFLGYKAGMTHIMRALNRPSSKAHQKDIVEAVTIIETPPMIVVGLVGYIETPTGLRSITTVWCSHVDDSFRRRMYKNWTRSKKKAFTNYAQHWSNAESGKEPKEILRRLTFIKKYANVVRIIAHTQVKKLKNLGLKKAHVLEIQINGGKSIEEKVDFGYKLFEKHVNIKDLFHENECIDTIGVTKGHGWKGVINRWGCARLPRKTHRGLRKVACIGSWHPARVQYTIAREGQKGYHHRTEIHKKIYRIGDSIQYGEDGKPKTFSASTEMDLTEKNITPMGGFVGYGIVKQDYVMIKGTCPGVKKRPIALRKAIVQPSHSMAKEEIKLKFIDTSSKMGHGRFQTKEEKKEWFGPTKKDRLEESKKKRDEKKKQQKKDGQKSKKKKSDKMELDDIKEEKEEQYQSKNEQRRAKGSKKKGSKKKGSAKKGSKKGGKGSKKKTQKKQAQ